MILSFLNFHVCSLPVPALQSGSLPLNLMASTGGITRSGKHKVSYGHGLLRIAIAAKYRRQRGKWQPGHGGKTAQRSEEHTSELQSLMSISYAVFCLKKKTNNNRDSATNSKCYMNQKQ